MKTLVLSLLMITLPFSAYAMGLRDSTILKDETITLGDIFYDLPRDEGRILGTSPRPGQDMVLNARTLLKIALALDLPWRPSSNNDQIVLRREATIIGYERIKEELHSALYDEGIAGNYELSIPAEFQQIVLPSDQPAELVVTRLSVDRHQGTFTALIAAPSVANPIQNISITGRMDSIIHVPVLVDNIQNGRVITASDIEMMKVPERNFAQGTIIDPDNLVGMTARRTVLAGRPIRDNEIIAPLVVERGEIVTMSLSYGGINLTTEVKALENGAAGDVIRVVNTESNQTLQALVTGTRAVRVVEN